jgi:3-oxoacyl-[acyl-carrier protein] reductase
MSESPVNWSAAVRNVIITGGSRGLGLGIAQRLASNGYRAIAIARKRSEQLDIAMRESLGGSGELCFHAHDLENTGTIPGLIRDLRKEFGPLYGLVNNAGLGTSGVLAIMPDGLTEQLFRINVLSPIAMSKYFVRAAMTDNAGRRIVNIASIVAATGFKGLSVYSGTKAALVGFTRSLARELGPLGITVNAIAPGFIDTDMTRHMDAVERDRVIRRSALGRLPDIQDVANTASFLLSEEAKNITGTVLTVDAGNTA